MSVSKKGQKKRAKKKTGNLDAGSKRVHNERFDYDLGCFYVLERVLSYISNDLPEDLRKQIRPVEEKCLAQLGSFLFHRLIHHNPEMLRGISATIPFMPTEELLRAISKVLNNKDLLVMNQKIASGKNEKYPKGVSKKEVDTLAKHTVDQFLKTKGQDKYPLKT